MKTCYQRGLTKSFDDFNRRASAADGRQKLCRDCSKLWYLGHREVRIRAVSVINAAQRANINQRLAAHLLANACMDCGETDVRVLDFDHRDDEAKVLEVMDLSKKRRTWQVIAREIAKCDVRCANCHRKRTLASGSSWRQRAYAAAAVEDSP